MPESSRLFLRQHDHLDGFLREALRVVSMGGDETTANVSPRARQTHTRDGAIARVLFFSIIIIVFARRRTSNIAVTTSRPRPAVARDDPRLACTRARSVDDPA